ncbi:hypothetical protein Vretimale_17258 [Volvox reticuliferus]|uniref:SET domain-containing protein n=2 Tax=Volvox reticuliferus TaxID=1737510 RepID=A0A8J4GUK7_9CHLO|nr:hypothetical protein Vretimale_17258 [Volvox reticuliferus]
MQADPVAYSVGCKLVDAAGETNGCDEHDGHCSDNDDGDSSGSDDVALYLETLQCRVSGSTWRCLPEHELSNVPYEYDDAAQAALVGGVALACETLTEGQASAGGDTVIAAPLPTGRTRAAAIATAADEDMNRAQEWDLDSSRAEGAPTDGTAADAPQFSGEGTSDPGNGEVEEGARQPPRSEANEPGGSAAFADGGNASDPEDCRLAERKFDTLQKPIQRSGYRRRQTARKEKPPVSRSLSHALCVRCGTASCCSGCNCDSNRGAVASADAVPPPPSDQQLPAAPSTGALAIAVRAASDDGIRQDGSGAKRRRIVVIGDGDDDNIPAPKAINDRGDSVAGLGTGLPGAVSDYRLCTGSPDLGSCHGESMMAEAEGDVAKPRPEDLRTLPVCGWGETTPAATELLGRLAREIGLDSPRVTPGLYVVHPLQTRGGKWTWSVEQLKKKHPALAEEVRRWHIPHRMRVVQITDPCHPVYNNDIIMRNCEPKQRMLVFTENLTPNTPLSAYFGTIKTQAESDEYVLADMTHGRQLMEAYTHTCDWTELHEGDSEKLVVVGDTRNCLMTYANEIRFWGTCDELWRDVSPIAEDVRRTGCRCECYRGRIANAECVQGIVKYRDLKGNMCYGFFILYYTSKHVQSGEEALIHWDKTGSFFNVIREATNTVRRWRWMLR